LAIFHYIVGKYNSLESVKQYIESAPFPVNERLQELRSFLLDNLPIEAKEGIIKGIPTYTFKMKKVQLSYDDQFIYFHPGSSALRKAKISTFEIVKEGIQLPHSSEIPAELIKDLLKEYSVNVWAEAYNLMEEIIQNTPLKKEKKWGTDVYTLNGQNVVSWMGFKQFFSIWFFKGVLMEDHLKVLIAIGDTKVQRQWRFRNVSEIDKNNILSYIREAMKLSDVIIPKEDRPEPQHPTELIEFLKANKDVKNAFETLSKSKRRDYIEYIAEAKQAATKAARLEKIKPMILGGKGLNDKYKK
jgi:uncharacterized protein YdeI (YjbR/CyaY-like superfamily)